MPNKKNDIPDQQVDTIPRLGEYVQESFDLDRLEDFVTGLGVQFFHYKGIPSPIGKNDRGDYRRNDGVDTITSNGMIYKCAGKFTATMTDNSRSRQRGEAGILDPSESRLVMPRFYDKDAPGDANGKRIYLSPGDRIYVSDPTVDVLVSNPQEVDYVPGADTIPMFPICEMEMMIDSRNQEYIQDVDYCITKDGNIRWLDGGKNPGINPETGKGRIFSIRYLYKAYWYITTILKEVRITQVTDMNGERKPSRMPYHCIAVREYIYHNQNKGDTQNQLQSKDPKRAVQAPTDQLNPSKYSVPVQMDDFGDGEE